MMNDYIVVRNKPDENGKFKVQLTKKDKVDLTEYRIYRIAPNGREEYCHQDEYEIYKKIFDKVDSNDNS